MDIHEAVEIVLGEMKKIHHNINAIEGKNYLQKEQMERLAKMIPGLRKALRFLHTKYFYKDLTPGEFNLVKTINHEVGIIETHLYHLNTLANEDIKEFHQFKESFNVFYKKFHHLLINVEKMKEMVKHDFNKEKALGEKPVHHHEHKPVHHNTHPHNVHHIHHPIKKEEPKEPRILDEAA